MNSLKLHSDLYSADAVAQAVSVYADYASVTVRQVAPYFEVDVTCDVETREPRVAAELANYALAITIEERRAPETTGSQEEAR